VISSSILWNQESKIILGLNPQATIFLRTIFLIIAEYEKKIDLPE